ncbi:MAG: helix-turn-helix transcriptional regulator [Edaphobacter sp.]|uniref:helix-turn-helix domain-containing protein n=1 Tax=Edaphobacter sp. TaxID=1934404 RepID=UPI00239ED51B|nr:helix-turn-helix transcriptional regulator [Edaphobacter sp.]MDE1175013.1 helix-turn-helix transcriptional regulator [Edaphobacter sp.]
MIPNDRILPGQPPQVSRNFVPQDLTRFAQLTRSIDFSSVNITSRFGARLRELRRSRNMTQLEMAIAFGIDRSYISEVERGRKAISLPTLEVIALGMDVSLSALLKDI